MVKVKIISDTHFFHKEILKYCRPQYKDLDEMHNDMIRIGNENVSKNDIVVHLGDVGLNLKENKENLKRIFDKLNGHKLLIPGNHDREIRKEDRHFFDDIGFFGVEDIDKGEGMEIEDAYGEIFGLSHEPLTNLPKNVINIHGHVHFSGEKGISYNLYNSMQNKRNVCGDNGGKNPKFHEIEVGGENKNFL